jgi:Leucine-rich repeat (LRR) protein
MLVRCHQTTTTELDLSNCGLRHLPPSLPHLVNITTLNVSKNKLTHLPSFLTRLSALSALYLEGNPLAPHLQALLAKVCKDLKELTARTIYLCSRLCYCY